ncbi:MAG: DUF368 domain-containing protein [Bacteroidales bacterium]|nr:DUF368 domain-containing protein [Bacteroidales bacterium]
MGAADVIPGVSGGTIAFLMGIYQELVDSIKSISSSNLKLLFKGKIVEFWKAINGTFLVSLFLGILVSVFSLARLMKYLLEFHPIPLWSFFFGLILASAFVILKELGKWNLQNILALVAGVAAAAYICLVSPSQTTEEYWFIFLSGAIAICAMILPGISGSFILLLLGKYHFVMSAVTELNIPVLCVFGAGAILGILSFSHLLSWLLKKFYMATIALLSGFMIGSLIKVWPWKEQVFVVDHPVLPGYYEQITGSSQQLGLSILFAVVGVVVVLVMEWASGKKSGK